MRSAFNTMSSIEALKAMQVVSHDLHANIKNDNASDLYDFVKGRMTLFNQSMDFMSHSSHPAPLREIANVYALYGEGDIAVKSADDPYLSVKGLNEKRAQEFIAYIVRASAVEHIQNCLQNKGLNNEQGAAKLASHMEQLFRAFPYADLVESADPEQNEDMLVYLDVIAKAGDDYTKLRASILKEHVWRATQSENGEDDVNLGPAMARFDAGLS